MSCSLMRHAVNSLLLTLLFLLPRPEAPVSPTLNSLRSAPLSPPSLFPFHSISLPVCSLPCHSSTSRLEAPVSPTSTRSDNAFSFFPLPSSPPSPPPSPPTLLPALPFLDLKAGSPCINDAAFALPLSPSLPRPLPFPSILLPDGWHLSDKCTSILPESIEELALCGADRHTDALIHGLADRLGPNLTKFAFSGFSRSIGSDPFVSLLSVSPRLVSLAIDGGEGLDVDTIVITAGMSCPLLRELSVYDMSLVTLDYLASCHLSHLTRFRHKRRHERGVGVSDSLLLRLMLLWPGLEELVLVDKAAEGVGQGRAEEALSDTGLLMLTAWAPSLTTLTLSLPSLSASKRCSEVALMQVASACTNLTHLDLSNFRCMSDPPLHEFVSRCPSLAHLSLAGATITDASLDLIASHCPNLLSLSIKCCRKLLEPGVSALARCSRLQSLNAALVPGVTDVSAPLLFQGATALKTLVLNQSPLPDISLLSLSSHCHGLEELALHGCPRLTNE
ncbi:unnamed protein product, partial [Closterium sp. Naga37s-1]